MTMDAELAQQFDELIRKDGRYAPEAFEFLHAGLEFATRRKYGATERPERHVSGKELCFALRDLALERWGPLAREVLHRWRIRKTRDFGEMVYLMIELGLMGRQPSDDIRDFDDVFDFETAFGGYEISFDREAEGTPD